MKLFIPENFIPDSANIESHMANAKTMVETMIKTGFSQDDINTVIENTSKRDVNEALACAAVLDGITISEAVVKHVDSRGTVTKIKDRKSREKNAYKSTGMSKARRREIARKAAKTRKANPSLTLKASRAHSKAMKKRRALGLTKK